MKMSLGLSKVVIILLQFLLSGVYGEKIHLVPDSVKLIEDCVDGPSYKKIHEILDFSEFKTKLSEDGSEMFVEGVIKALYPLEKSDKIKLVATLHILEKEVWKPTLIPIVLKDACTEVFEPNSIWYRTWTQHIPSEERNCDNWPNQLYNHPKFSLKLEMNGMKNLRTDTRYRLEVLTTILDAEGNKRSEPFCGQVYGKIVKVP